MRPCLAILMLTAVIFTSGCVEVFNFDTSREERLLVVDGIVSDVSFADSEELPMYGRYFEVNLKFTSGVVNNHDEQVSGAQVEIVDDVSESWDYTEVEPGIYRLYFDEFKAEQDRSYQLKIEMANGDQYESTFVQLPEALPKANFYFEEEEVLEYGINAGDLEITSTRGITFKSQIPAESQSDDFRYYRWDFTNTYEVIAWGLDPDHINHRCWINTGLVFKNYVLAKNKIGGQPYELFFLATDDQYIHEGYSVLFRQMELTPEYYQFWYDLEKQEEQEDLFAPPPYNLNTNMSPVGHDNPVYGYFAAVNEQFHRWYFSKDDISYYIHYPEELQRCGSPPGPECFDCRLLSRPFRSLITNTQPTWWED